MSTINLVIPLKLAAALDDNEAGDRGAIGRRRILWSGK